LPLPSRQRLGGFQRVPSGTHRDSRLRAAPCNISGSRGRASGFLPYLTSPVSKRDQPETQNAQDQDKSRSGEAFFADRIRLVQTQRLPSAAHPDQEKHEAEAPAARAASAARSRCPCCTADDALLLSAAHSRLARPSQSCDRTPLVSGSADWTSSGDI